MARQATCYKEEDCKKLGPANVQKAALAWVAASQRQQLLAILNLHPLEMVVLKLPILFLLAAATFALGCAKNLDGNTSFQEAKKGFEKELPAEKRKQTIKALQAETNAANREARTTDRTVTPLPPQVVTPVNPPPGSQPRN